MGPNGRPRDLCWGANSDVFTLKACQELNAKVDGKAQTAWNIEWLMPYVLGMLNLYFGSKLVWSQVSCENQGVLTSFDLNKSCSQTNVIIETESMEPSIQFLSIINANTI